MKASIRSDEEIDPVASSDVARMLAERLLDGALPGETDGLDGPARASVAAFLARAAQHRLPGKPAFAIQSVGGEGGRRHMRVAVINDDMPFLVDSTAATLAAHGLDVHRLLHPVVAVRRDADGELLTILPRDASGERRESIIYLEGERGDARVRRALAAELTDMLAEVRAAVTDWPRLQVALRDDADGLPDGEGAALLRWFLAQHFTLLGHRTEAQDGAVADALGIFRLDGPPLWSEATRAAAFGWFAQGGEAPLVLKADRISKVHRRAAMDLLILPVRRAGELAGLSIHAGLWTSAALRAPSSQVPVLRQRLTALEAKHGFDPQAHAGKALRHVLSSLPHDLLIAIDGEDLERLALTAMSLADRPRPQLVLAPSWLRRHLFAFVWLPRDDLSTTRRTAIGGLLESASGARISSWSMELGEGDLALIRYTLDLPENAALPDESRLNDTIEAMLRGWYAQVESHLAEGGNATRASRLALGWAECFPAGYRDRSDAAEAAADIQRLAPLENDARRGARLFRRPSDAPERLRLKIFRRGSLIPLSEAVPVLENFGFRVLEEIPTPLGGGASGYIHEFLLELDDAAQATALIDRTQIVEEALVAVLEARAENDEFNALIVSGGLQPRDIVLFRAWFRYLRQTGLAYGLQTVADVLARTPDVARGLVALFDARHDPSARERAGQVAAAQAAVDGGLARVAAIDDDRILRRLLALVLATLRTNAFAASGREALAFKLDSAAVPGLPKPLPWREIWVYAPRVEGIHLRGGPIARGGLRWSDRRDDFRTEILGLMKAQVVKNAVIVPTGAKGGFYPKHLPPSTDRDAWLAEGTESYRIFIRALLSLTDNYVAGQVVHPDGVVIHDGDDPYFVVAADKGTATFSDVANAISLERDFWLGDAFASGGSVGYDHKAMGITARGAWISVQRHFAERGVDVQSQTIRVAGCGDMSGDVFGNGMLLSKSLKLVAAFDHRHIFLDPDPDPAASWTERARLFALPRSSWADYDAKLLSEGGAIVPRSQKSIPLSAHVKAMLGVTEDSLDPSALIAAILKAPVDLLWFGGIGTYVKARDENNSEVGDPANDANRVDAEDVRAIAIGEGANLGVTQAARIAFSEHGGRINTDFIDNSAGVDCSDNEVNIKIALNQEMAEGRLTYDDRNALLERMTGDVAALVLEDNRLQTLALSLAEHGGADVLPSQVRVIEILESAGRINRAVDGLERNEDLLRRAQEARGLTRPELAVLLSHAKLALQEAVEKTAIPADPLLRPLLHAAFPAEMRERFAAAIDEHRLRSQIIATKMANRVVNRLGFVAPFALAEEEGVSIAQVAGAYFAVDAIYDLEPLWRDIEQAAVAEPARLVLMDSLTGMIRLHVADLLRVSNGEIKPSVVAAALAPGIARLETALHDLLRQEARLHAAALRTRLAGTGADQTIVDRIARLFELDGAIGTASLGERLGLDELVASTAYVRLGEALGLDWAKEAALRFASPDPWERLFVAGLARDFEQLRLDFLARVGSDGKPVEQVDRWLAEQAPRVAQFRQLVQRVRAAPSLSIAMLAQIGGQARVLLSR